MKIIYTNKNKINFFIMLCKNIYYNTENFGIPIGITKQNVVAFSNDENTKDIKKYNQKNYYNGIFTGYKYECVEFVRRWLIIVCNITFQDVNDAVDIFKLNHFNFIGNNMKIPIKIISNKSIKNISFGDIIIYNKKGIFSDYGHVAVIVYKDGNYLYIAEQNVDNKSWKDKNYSRKLYYDNNTIYDKDYKDVEILGIIKLFI